MSAIKKHSILSALVLAGALSLLMLKSDLLSNKLQCLHIDSQVYHHVATQISKGLVLYKDVFDHKGPMFHFIECLGVLITPNSLYILFILQYLFVYVGLCAVLSAKSNFSLSNIVAIFLTVSFMYYFFSIGDNIPELYAIFFIGIIYYVLLGYEKEKKLSSVAWIIAGFASTAILLIKINLICTVLPLWFFVLFSRKNKDKVLVSVMYSLIGLSICVAPFVIYFWYQDALQQAFFACWTFNLHYIQENSCTYSESLLQVIGNKSSILWLLCLIGLLRISIYQSHARAESLTLFATWIFSIIILIILPKRGTESLHYMLPLTPAFLWSVLFIMKHSSRNLNKLYLLVSLACLVVPVNNAFSLTQKQCNEKSISILMQQKKEGETLSVFGNYSCVYTITSMPCNTPYFYTYPILQNCLQGISNDFMAAFKSMPADWVLQEKKYLLPSCQQSLLSTYEMIYEDENFCLYKR